MSEYYAYFSPTQFELRKRDLAKPYVYYILLDDSIVLISEISQDESKSNFADKRFLGKTKGFYKASNYPINL